MTMMMTTTMMIMMTNNDNYDNLGGRDSDLRAGVDVNPTMALAADRRAHRVCYT